MNLQKVKDGLAAHYKSTTPMDEYFTGMYNGIEYALCVLEEREPNYKECEKPSHRKMHLETLIRGHMEAMRPMLDEWNKIL